VATIWEKLDAVHKYTFLAEHFPRFIAAFGPLDGAIRQTFCCGLDESAATPADVAIYGLGRLCLEDFGEILFLSEHDYGYAAIKLLRGLYERAVVSEVMVENPTAEGQRFVNYCAVEAMKFRNRAKGVYKGRWRVKDDDELESEFNGAVDAECRRGFCRGQRLLCRLLLCVNDIERNKQQERRARETFHRSPSHT
jgi:hypothetical protein